ncbi:MAG: 3'-5' exonuclease [Bdellovibrionales bacterium]|nr:3'-5' exonuclease [Bdellovibrionales bacterium]
MNFVAFDLETTGFLPGVDQIVEIGAVRYVGGQAEAVFSTLVDPKMKMPIGASKVNGITDDMLQGKPTIDTLLDPFAEFCSDLVVVAHNAAFDAQFLSADIKKFETKAPTGVILDTLGIARKVIPGLPNYKLGTLVDHLDIPAGEFHRAEEDASYCGQLFIHLVRKMTGGLNLPPIENLIQLTGKPLLNFPQISPEPKQLGLF